MRWACLLSLRRAPRLRQPGWTLFDFSVNSCTSRIVFACPFPDLPRVIRQHPNARRTSACVSSHRNHRRLLARGVRTTTGLGQALAGMAVLVGSAPLGMTELIPCLDDPPLGLATCSCVWLHLRLRYRLHGVCGLQLRQVSRRPGQGKLVESKFIETAARGFVARARSLCSG